MEYGEAVPDAPTLAPSTLNWTPAIASPPPLSADVAVRVTLDPETVAPLDGTVSETEGGMVSEGGAGVVFCVAGAEPPIKIICPGVYPGSVGGNGGSEVVEEAPPED